MMAKADKPKGEMLDVLVTLIEAYERKHYPIDFPDPTEAIKFVMEQKSLAVKDLGQLSGKPIVVMKFSIKKAMNPTNDKAPA